MIKIIYGNLFDSDAKLICHQVNCQGKFNSGVAKEVRERYPHIYIEYIKYANTHLNPLGEVLTVPTNSNFLGYNIGNLLYRGQYICNLFAQDNYGYDGKCYTNYDALRKCFEQIKWMTMWKNILFNAKIAMPYKIGCVRGGADWDKVYKMIEDIFEGVEVELWRLDKG